MSAIRRARSEPGTRFQLHCTDTEDLKAMLDTALTSADQIVDFIALIRFELIKRGEHPSNPNNAAS